MNSTTTTKPSEAITSSNGHLLANSIAEDSAMASRTASIEAIEATTFEEQQLRYDYESLNALGLES